MKILFIDDSQDNIDLFKIYMSISEDEAFYSLNVDDALELSKTEDIDIYFVDISMPGKDGYDFIKELDPEIISKKKIFALTAHHSEEEKQKILDANFRDLLLKPITRKGLLSFLEKNK